MSGLASKHGKLLTVDGKLVFGDCYCDCSADGCGNCCMGIDWGTFNEDGDLEETFTNLVVTVVMPTKNVRWVCDGEQITVRLEFTLDPEGDASQFAPFVRWDRSWKYISHTPLAVLDDGEFLDGLIEWEYLVDNGPSYYDTYEVVLEYDKCWADSGTQYGDIEAGDRLGDFAVITSTFCTSVDCCDPVITCESCCFYIADTYEENEAGNPVFWAENAIGDRMKVEVRGLDATKKTICIPDNLELTFVIELIPAQFTSTPPWYPNLNFTGEGWTRFSHSPAIGAGGSVDDGPPVEIVWGTDVSATEYEIMTYVPCPLTPSTVTIQSAKNSDGAGDPMQVLVEFLCCGGVDDCDDCWPLPDTEWMHCRIDISGSNVAVPGDITLSDHHGAATTPANLPDWKCFAIWENYCCVDGEPTQSGFRLLDVIFRCCAHGRACSKTDAQAALEAWVDATFGPQYTVADCDLNVPPDQSIAAIIASTVGIAASAGDLGYQVVYKEEAEEDCPPCPEET